MVVKLLVNEKIDGKKHSKGEMISMTRDKGMKLIEAEKAVAIGQAGKDIKAIAMKREQENAKRLEARREDKKPDPVKEKKTRKPKSD